MVTIPVCKSSKWNNFQSGWWNINEEWGNCGMRPGIRIVKRQLAGPQSLQETDCEKDTCRWGGGGELETVTSHLKLSGLLRNPLRPEWSKEIKFYSWSFGPYVYPTQKDNTIADWLENQFTPHNLCDENHKRCVRTTDKAVLDAVGKSPLKSKILWHIKRYKFIKTE
jgi:hypothetical protein